MKKLLPLIFVTLLLAGCTSQGSTKMTDDQIFQKKQECAGYNDEMGKQLETLNDLGVEMQRVLSVGEIFYSPVKNSCIYTVKLSQEKIDLRTEQELNKISLSIIDYLNGKVLFSVSKDLFNVDGSGFNKQDSYCAKQFLSGINEVISPESKGKAEQYFACMQSEYNKVLKELKGE